MLLCETNCAAFCYKSQNETEQYLGREDQDKLEKKARQRIILKAVKKRQMKDYFRGWYLVFVMPFNI